MRRIFLRHPILPGEKRESRTLDAPLGERILGESPGTCCNKRFFLSWTVGTLRGLKIIGRIGWGLQKGIKEGLF